MSKDKKVHYIRGKKEVSKAEADAVDLKNNLLSRIDDEDKKESTNSRLDRAMSVLGINEDGDLVATYPDGRQEIIDDD